MKNEYLSIGEMAQMNHTTVPALRLYDKMGLLKPMHVDPLSNYRYYDVKQNARLDLIQYMKELGMQLKEIKAVLDKEDIALIEEILKEKKQDVQNSIQELNRKKAAIDRTIESIERYQRSPRSGTITLEYIPLRPFYAMKTGTNFYDYGIDTYEMILKQLKQDLVRNHLPQIYYCNAGTILKKEDFESLHFVSDTMFVFADEQFPHPEKLQTFEAGMYACIYSDSFELEKDYAAKLLKHCEENGYRILGDYLCEVLMEFDVFDRNERSMFLRLQVPVQC